MNYVSKTTIYSLVIFISSIIFLSSCGDEEKPTEPEATEQNASAPSSTSDPSPASPKSVVVEEEKVEEKVPPSDSPIKLKPFDYAPEFPSALSSTEIKNFQQDISKRREIVKEFQEKLKPELKKLNELCQQFPNAQTSLREVNSKRQKEESAQYSSQAADEQKETLKKALKVYNEKLFETTNKLFTKTMSGELTKSDEELITKTNQRLQGMNLQLHEIDDKFREKRSELSEKYSSSNTNLADLSPEIGNCIAAIEEHYASYKKSMSSQSEEVKSLIERFGPITVSYVGETAESSRKIFEIHNRSQQEVFLSHLGIKVNSENSTEHVHLSQRNSPGMLAPGQFLYLIDSSSSRQQKSRSGSLNINYLIEFEELYNTTSNEKRISASPTPITCELIYAICDEIPYIPFTTPSLPASYLEKNAELRNQKLSLIVKNLEMAEQKLNADDYRSRSFKELKGDKLSLLKEEFQEKKKELQAYEQEVRNDKEKFPSPRSSHNSDPPNKGSILVDRDIKIKEMIRRSNTQLSTHQYHRQIEQIRTYLTRYQQEATTELTPEYTAITDKRASLNASLERDHSSHFLIDAAFTFGAKTFISLHNVSANEIHAAEWLLFKTSSDGTTKEVFTLRFQDESAIPPGGSVCLELQSYSSSDYLSFRSSYANTTDTKPIVSQLILPLDPIENLQDYHLCEVYAETDL